MKKILTLLIAAGAFFTLHAQSREESRRVIFGGPTETDAHNRDVVWERTNDNGRHPSYPNGGDNNSRQYRIEQVNREYDSKILSIRNNRYLSNSEKRRMIRQLERGRQNRISEINRRFNKEDRRFDDDDRKDNGKHKGWYKKAKNKNWKRENRN